MTIWSNVIRLEPCGPAEHAALPGALRRGCCLVYRCTIHPARRREAADVFAPMFHVEPSRASIAEGPPVRRGSPRRDPLVGESIEVTEDAMSGWDEARASRSSGAQIKPRTSHGCRRGIRLRTQVTGGTADACFHRPPTSRLGSSEWQSQHDARTTTATLAPAIGSRCPRCCPHAWRALTRPPGPVQLRVSPRSYAAATPT